MSMTRRDEVIRHLGSPRCAREIREMTGFQRKTVETILARATKAGIVRCITPRARQSRLYALTTLGRLMRLERVPESRHDRPYDEEIPWDLYAWVQAGRYRRLALKHLRNRLRPRTLRQAIKADYERIGMTHVYGVLRELKVRALVLERDGTWALTALGRELRRLAFPEISRTATGPAGWEPIDRARDTQGRQ